MNTLSNSVELLERPVTAQALTAAQGQGQNREVTSVAIGGSNASTETFRCSCCGCDEFEHVSAYYYIRCARCRKIHQRTVPKFGLTKQVSRDPRFIGSCEICGIDIPAGGESLRKLKDGSYACEECQAVAA